MEVGNGYGLEEHHTQPANVLAANWMLGKPAAFDFAVTSPLTSNNLAEASVTAGSAAFVTERPSGLNHTQLASSLVMRHNCSKSTATSSLYGRLSLTLVRANVRALLSRFTQDLID
ncbi:hypothetical protein EMCRGX_G022450 [Ephydatia muelleri]